MRRWLLAPLAAFALAGCAEETPTGVGGGLLPANAVVTFDVVLDASRFLVADTAFGLYSQASDADFTVLANGWDGALDSRVVARYTLPTNITVRDPAGVPRTDTLPRFTGGRIIVVVDTVRSTPAPVRLGLYRTVEAWHDDGATWALRVDTPGVRLQWSQPGAGSSILVDTATWVAGNDTVVLRADSATMRLWQNVGDPARGAMIAVLTPGARLRTSLPLLHAESRSSINPDTLVVTPIFAPQLTFIYQPAPGTVSGNPRVGGTPAWRTLFRLRGGLDTVTVACPTSPTCRVRLADVTVNRAALQLQPVPSPRGLAPEAPLSLAAHFVLQAPGVPLERSPVTDVLTTLPVPVPTSSFMAPGAPLVELPLTDLVVNTIRGPTGTDPFQPTWFALLPAGTRTLGFGSFAAMPTLRLTLSTARELQLP